MALTASAEQGSKRTVIMVIVILIHGLALWGLQAGLARRLVELLPNDIQTKIIDEKKNEEPPPPPPPPPPDMPVQPPPFVPPVEVSIAAPAMESTAITAVTNEKPLTVAPPIMAPRQQVVVRPRVDAKKSLGSCDQLYNESSALKRDGAQGSVVVRCTIGANGKCPDASIGQSSGIDALDQLATKCAKEWLRFIPGTVDGAVQPTVYEFKLTFKPQNER